MTAKKDVDVSKKVGGRRTRDIATPPVDGALATTPAPHPGDDWEGVPSLNDPKAVNVFVAAVEEAFGALHQPSGDPHDLDESATVKHALFREWAQSVEDRMEHMGLARVPLDSPTVPTAEVHDDALRHWTKRVWARFAALGRLLDV